MRVDPVRLALDTLDLLRTALAPILARLATLDDQVAALSVPVAPPAPALDLALELGAVRERLARLEAAPATPGPAGDPGAAGIGFADPPVEFDGIRTFTFRFSDGRSTVVTPPIQVYQGVYVTGRLYATGDTVTARGNLWHCNTPTTVAPGADVGAWSLMVRRGRDRKGGAA